MSTWNKSTLSFFYAYWDCTCLSIRLHWWARLIGINMTNTLTAVCRFSVSMVLWCISQPEPAGLCAVYRHISSILAAIWKLAAPPECASICFCMLSFPTDDEWCFHWQSVNMVACYALRLSPSWLEKKKPILEEINAKSWREKRCVFDVLAALKQHCHGIYRYPCWPLCFPSKHTWQINSSSIATLCMLST